MLFAFHVTTETMRPTNAAHIKHKYTRYYFTYSRGQTRHTIDDNKNLRLSRTFDLKQKFSLGRSDRQTQYTMFHILIKSSVLVLFEICRVRKQTLALVEGNSNYKPVQVLDSGANKHSWTEAKNSYSRHPWIVWCQRERERESLFK